MSLLSAGFCPCTSLYRIFVSVRTATPGDVAIFRHKLQWKSLRLGGNQLFSWLVNQTPPGHVPPPRNKGLIAGLIKGNQWLISPDHKAGYFCGGYGGGGLVDEPWYLEWHVNLNRGLNALKFNGWFTWKSAPGYSEIPRLSGNHGFRFHIKLHGRYAWEETRLWFQIFLFIFFHFFSFFLAGRIPETIFQMLKLETTYLAILLVTFLGWLSDLLKGEVTSN